MSIRTRFTDRFGVHHPIMLAPMAMVSSGRLAAAVTAAGGLGAVGGGYGDADWLNRELVAADDERVACGFITWSLAKQPQLLALALEHKPAAIMLSFGDPTPFAEAVRTADVPLICQVQSIAHAREALAAGADVLVAQGGEAGGHGASRGTFALVPAVVDLVRQTAPETLVMAAGGVTDGRGLAAALVLGADGVLVGTRFYASDESPAAAQMKRRIVEADGDHTVRTTVFDVARDLGWPEPFTARAVKNLFTENWHGNETRLVHARAAEAERYRRAAADHDSSVAAVFAGEGVDMIHDIVPVAEIIERIAQDAEQRLRAGENLLH